MTRLLVATTNLGKVREFASLLTDLPVALVSLRDVDIDRHVVEDALTFAGNARKKALTYATRSGLLSLADDSGLEVDALGGAPGVHSARYAGEGAGDEANLRKLLAALVGIESRAARFRCALAVATPDGRIVAESDGVFEGRIGHDPRGDKGFGYDPIFLCDDGRSVAELTDDEKHARSHRGAAVRALAPSLRKFLAT